MHTNMTGYSTDRPRQTGTYDETSVSSGQSVTLPSGPAWEPLLTLYREPYAVYDHDEGTVLRVEGDDQGLAEQEASAGNRAEFVPEGDGTRLAVRLRYEPVPLVWARQLEAAYAKGYNAGYHDGMADWS